MPRGTGSEAPQCLLQQTVGFKDPGEVSLLLSELLERTHPGEWVAAVRTALHHLVTSPAFGSIPCSWQEDGRVYLLLGPSCSHSLLSPSVSAFRQVVAVSQQCRKDACLPLAWAGGRGVVWVSPCFQPAATWQR